MKCAFSQKTQLWRPSGKFGEKSRKGAFTLLAAFLSIVFAAMGMGMLSVSQIYLKISGYKVNAAVLDIASENGIKQGFKALLRSLTSLPNPDLLSETEMETLRLDTLSSGTALIDRLSGSSPSFFSSSWEKMSWESSTTVTLDSVAPKDDYFRAVLTADIQSSGRLQNFRPSKTTSLELEITAAAGHLPLSQFPFLLDRNLDAEALREFEQENPVELSLSAPNTMPAEIRSVEEPILPRSASPLIEKALNIRLFQPDSLTSAQWREALGLDVSTDPVPQGVYLIQDDTGLGGIFVQGDCEEIILAVDGDYQVISFTQGESDWILRFSPPQKKTEFLTPEGIRVFDSIPIGIILINGAVRSFGGGNIDPNGNVELRPDEEQACLLDGVNLTVVCSDEIVLSSHLILQGVKWHEGIPYVKDSKAMLNIFSPGHDLIDGTEKKGKITVENRVPQELKIQASLTASGQGMAIEGDNKTVELLGSVQTTDYDSGGNTLKVIWDERLIRQDELLVNTPRSSRPVLSLLSLEPCQWTEIQNTIKNE